MTKLDDAIVKQKQPYLCGSDQSIADIIVYNELSMYMKIKNYTWEGREMNDYPNLNKWAEKMRYQSVITRLEEETFDELKKLYPKLKEL